MKLKYFSEQTLPKQMGGGLSSIPKVSFSKGGIIQFNAAAIKLLDLSEGDRLSIAQDEEDRANFYLFKDPEQGFSLRPGYDKKVALSLLFNHKKLQVMVCQAYDLDAGQTHQFLVAGQPTVLKGDKTKYWGLLQKAKV